MTKTTTFRVKGTDVFIKGCPDIERGMFCLSLYGHKVTSDQLEVFEVESILDFPVGSHIFNCF